MRKVRSLGAAIILSLLILASTITAFGDTRTVKFNDIDASWAKQNIVNVYKNGLMDGITETTFKPKDNVKSFDVIVSIARMLNGGSSDNLSKYETKYKSTLDDYKIPTQYRKEVAYCIEKGILVINKNDVSTLTNNQNDKSKKLYATKIDICVYLGRAFGIKVNKDIGLTYKDAIFIYSDYKAYVDFLAKKGVVSSTGNEKGEFQPYANISRETFAKMLDVANGVYEKEYKDGGSNTNTDTTTTPPATTPTTPANTGNTDTSTNTTDSDTGITITNQNADTYTAVVDQVIPEYGNIIVYIKDNSGTQTKKVYKIADNVTCSIDGANSYYYKLKKGDVISLGVSDDKIVRITAESATKKLVGVLTDIKITDKISLVMETAKKETKEYTITEKTTIIKDGKKANYQDLNKGNNIVVTIVNNEMVEINADGVKNSDKGIIESITYSRTAAPKVVIVAGDGRRGEYYVSKGITSDNITIDGASSNIYALRPGMQVSLDIVDDEITNIVTIKTVANVEVRAVVKSVNTDWKLIKVEVYDSTSNKTIEKIVSVSDTKIADQELNTLSLNQLKVGDTIRIYGTEDTEGIVAKSIIVER